MCIAFLDYRKLWIRCFFAIILPFRGWIKLTLFWNRSIRDIVVELCRMHCFVLFEFSVSLVFSNVFKFTSWFNSWVQNMRLGDWLKFLSASWWRHKVCLWYWLSMCCQYFLRSCRRYHSRLRFSCCSSSKLLSIIICRASDIILSSSCIISL